MHVSCVQITSSLISDVSWPWFFVNILGDQKLCPGGLVFCRSKAQPFYFRFQISWLYIIFCMNCTFLWACLLNKMNALRIKTRFKYTCLWRPAWIALLLWNPRIHDDVIKWKRFPRYWPFVHGIHRSPVNAPQKDQWRGALMFSFICVWINGWVNNRKAGDLRRYRAHYDVTVMITNPWYSLILA